MPKEKIRCTHSPDVHAEIRWHPDSDGSGHVQIATVNTAASTLSITGSLGPAPRTSSSVSRPEPTSAENGWFVDLDREGINRMIRMLRRARDAAYGADA